ncbi:MAG: integrase core domain-containing protein [Bacteroidota bacterium]
MQRRGPKPEVNDETALQEIRSEIAHCPFHSEGYKKIRIRMRRRGIRVGKQRVLRLMKTHQLLAPVRPKKTGLSRPHDGSIRTELPNQLWGTDGKQFRTEEEGMCWFFGVIDHHNDELLSWHCAKRGNRFAALEPVRQSVKKCFGGIGQNIAQGTGLFLRSDHGTQYDSRDFQQELKFLGVQHSPVFARSPECNGIIERFHRILQEQVFDVHQFKNLEEARKMIGEFIEQYSNHWMIERLGYLSPVEYKNQHQNIFLKSA